MIEIGPELAKVLSEYAPVIGIIGFALACAWGARK